MSEAVIEPVSQLPKRHKVSKKTPKPASVIHAYDLIDSIFPDSPQAKERRERFAEGKSRKPHVLNLELYDHFQLTKGFLSSIVKGIEAIGDVSSRLTPGCQPEDRNYSNNTSTCTIRVCDIPFESYGFSAKKWLILAIKTYTGVDCREEDAGTILQEAELIRMQAFGMSQGGRIELRREVYHIGQENLPLAKETLNKEQKFLSDAKRHWFDDDSNPFQNFRFSVAPTDLDSIPRFPCTKCKKLCHIYCAECLLFALPTDTGSLDEKARETLASQFLDPSISLKLPLGIDIVHHPQEKITKSTGLHACFASPDQAQLIEFPDDIPDHYTAEDTIVLFPSADSVEISDTSLDFSKIKRAVIVEATWQKANTVIKHPKLAALPKIRLTERISTFWRHQELGNQFLSTLEAIYYLCVEVHERQNKDSISSDVPAIETPEGFIHPVYTSKYKDKIAEIDNSLLSYKGEFDDLLVLYANRQQRVHNQYKNMPQSQVPRVWRSKAINADNTEIDMDMTSPPTDGN